jgi:hypothetical protein
MKARKLRSRSKPTDEVAERLRAAIHSVGDYKHVQVRAERGHLNIYADEFDPVARLTPLGGGEYGLSFRNHHGRWEPMPFAGTIRELAQVIVTTLGIYLERWDFSVTKSGSKH